jgi:hypothetical protein
VFGSSRLDPPLNRQLLKHGEALASGLVVFWHERPSMREHVPPSDHRHLQDVIEVSLVNVSRFIAVALLACNLETLETGEDRVTWG